MGGSLLIASASGSQIGPLVSGAEHVILVVGGGYVGLYTAAAIVALPIAVKVGYRPGLDRTAVIDLLVRALFEAADEDSATGGPDAVRGIYPTVATITDAETQLGKISAPDALADLSASPRLQKAAAKAANCQQLSAQNSSPPG